MLHLIRGRLLGSQAQGGRYTSFDYLIFNCFFSFLFFAFLSSSPADEDAYSALLTLLVSSLSLPLVLSFYGGSVVMMLLMTLVMLMISVYASVCLHACCMDCQRCCCC